jgi:hypothetical protein
MGDFTTKKPTDQGPRHDFLPAPQPPPAPTRQWLTFTAAIAVSPATRDRLAQTIAPTG